ncbi:MAG TPA: hypothetical protein VFN42_12760 [Acetobacteraceae bacterium]|nr:hypothetical protein [Acetobacteraceae bacterium]
MTLAAFQAALGHLVRSGESGGWDQPALSANERVLLHDVAESAGLRLTAAIQRSWCEGRAAKAARLTLAMLPPAERRGLVEAWVAAGGGTNSFHATETERFCAFIAERLADPSHALTVCRLEQATMRAALASETYVPVRCDAEPDPDCALVAGRGAGLVPFFASPAEVLGALRGGVWPACGPVQAWLLFAPGLDGLARPASEAETLLWFRLTRAVAAGETVKTLVAAGFEPALIRAFLGIGAAEPASGR